MFKKILVGGFLLLMVGAVAAGAYALFSQAESAEACTQTRASEPRAVARQGIGERGGRLESGPQGDTGTGQELGREQRSRAEEQTEHAEWQTLEGVVVETQELVITTAHGETVQVGLGPSHYRDAQGFILAEGIKVSVQGYWEDGEFKAAEITNLDTGDSITLRDASGRPMWAGQGRGQGRS
jgi:hypothetical protein